MCGSVWCYHILQCVINVLVCVVLPYLTVCYQCVGLCDVTSYIVLSLCGSVWRSILDCVINVRVCVVSPYLTVCYHYVGLCDVTISYSVLSMCRSV